ncbi:MarR family transcriptional regulator [Halalkaliarchaeum desulfuricum]|uniref:MarR family transcriptional regulator n=1 Tax=Halalkaliarchaeum desulfuricum TaxID=2055893 RepID=UPI00105AB085
MSSVPHGNMKATESGIIRAFKESSDPFLTTTELAEQFDMTRQGMAKRLDRLAERGVLTRKSCGSGYGWWLDQESSTSDSWKKTSP